MAPKLRCRIWHRSICGEMFALLMGPAGLSFMKMNNRLSEATGVTQQLTVGHGADHANGSIDTDWDFKSDIPNRMAGGFD